MLRAAFLGGRVDIEILMIESQIIGIRRAVVIEVKISRRLQALGRN